MKRVIVSLLVLVACTVVIAASFNATELDFTVSVLGLEERDVIKEGLKPIELTTLTIRTNTANVSVAEFRIFHARGKSPINGAVVQGDRFDISQYRKQAKSGDRIVIEVTGVTESGKGKTSLKDKIIQIPIN